MATHAPNQLYQIIVSIEKGITVCCAFMMISLTYLTEFCIIYKWMILKCVELRNCGPFFDTFIQNLIVHLFPIRSLSSPLYFLLLYQHSIHLNELRFPEDL